MHSIKKYAVAVNVSREVLQDCDLDINHILRELMENAMGGEPNKGTPKDKRLTENTKPKPAAPKKGK